MQKGIHVILLPLFLCILFGIILVLCSSSDTWNSVLLSSSIVGNSVMAPKMMWTRTKRLLQDCHDENHNSRREIQEISDHQNLADSISEAENAISGRNEEHQSHPRSRRASELRMRKKNQRSDNQCSRENDDASRSEHCRKRFRSNQQNPTAIPNQGLPGTLQCLERGSSSQLTHTDGIGDQCSHSFGQALYQRSRQGFVVRYQDSGDDIHKCVDCNACFWPGEAITQSSSNAPLIYTNCFDKGQIKLQQLRPAPSFLERLLDPNNGSESRIFRENIRVYNSMFSFTSMGARIDHKINTRSGPCVFKISYQVHQLMGSMLPPDGECLKYVQLYIYDTKNEVSNRVNAIDPTHVHVNIKADIVKGLIEMFDEINELVKEFKTMRDKFENYFLPSLNMSILNSQPTDSKQYEQPTADEIGGLIVGDIGERNSNKDIIIESNSGCFTTYFQNSSKVYVIVISNTFSI